jgi:hypothetical protein
MKGHASCLLLLAAATYAQTSSSEFPADSTQVTASALQDSLGGKVYSVKLPDGNSWRMDFRLGGSYFWNNARGVSDVGKWSVQEGKVCTEGKRIGSSCNEVRRQGDALLLKRDNGEIVVMTLQ